MRQRYPWAITILFGVLVLALIVVILSACGSDDDANRPPRADISVESVGEGWRVVNVNGIACVERSWVALQVKQYAISCVSP